MRRRDFAKLLDGTSDAAYAVDNEGVIVAWNRAANRLFGLTAAQAIGQHCCKIVRGFDECGPVCSDDCHVLQSVNRRVPLENFDLRIQSALGEQWCNISVLIIKCQTSTLPYAIHMLRPNDLRKRLEMVMRDFVAGSPPPAGRTRR
jgi:PAS domain-containing protein